MFHFMRRTQLFSAALLALAWLAGGTALAHDGDHSYTNGICTIEGCTDKYQAPALVDGWYELTNAGNVEWIGDYVQNVAINPNVKMMNDIDFTGVSFRMIGRNSGRKFNGVFDGQGHRITNLTLEDVTENAKSVLGFFAWVRGGSTIKNLIMDSSCYFHGYKRVSAFVGVTQVNSGGAVNILNCVNEATVKANDNPAGAFVGCRNPENNDTPQIIIDGCVNIGTITAKSETAAFVGWANRENNDVGWTNHIVRNSYNFGTINNIDGNKRGFIRSDNLQITNSYDFGSNKANNNQNVSYSWTTADPVASGELAFHLNQVANAQVLYQTLETDAYPVPFNTHLQVYSHGDFRCDGEPLGTVTFDNTDSGDVIPPHNYSANGFCQNEGCTKPNQAPELVSEWYELTNAGNVEWFSDKVNGGEIAIKGKMMNDIDFTGVTHTPIGNSTGKKFNGTFDGQGFRIKNMIINRDSENGVGFFGYLRGAGTTTIQNLIIDASCSIHGNNRVGAITGSFQVGGGTITIENVVNEANVSANGQDAAGIIGGREDHNPTFIIKNVLNKGNVTSTHADAYVGALCCYLEGNGDSRIENFVNLGTIGTHKGGNIGRHNIGNVTNLIDLSDTENKTQGTESGLVAADVASGKLAWYLNNNDNQEDDAFYQTISTDAYPMPFEKAGAVVYRNGEERCDGADNENTVYSNTEGTIVTGSHDYNATTGFCDLCSMPNPEFKTLADGFYVLDNVIDMKWFAAMVQFIDPAINGKLTADLDFESGNCRIGTDTKAYRGTFQGGDHVISNFVVNNDEIFQGLFGYVTGGADISGLVFDKTCSIKCNARGAMIGGAKDGGTVKLTRLGNEGDVTTTNENAAGIIGTDMKGACVLQIDQCYSTGTIVGGKESAQIAGWTGNNSIISNSWSCAKVTGVQSGREFSRYGGDNHDGQYVNCFTTYHETNGGLTYDTPAEDFASGKVAYTICKEAGSAIFGQKIDTDATPTFFGPEVSYVGDAGYATMYDTTTGYELNGDVKAYVATPNPEYPNLILTEIENVPESTPVILKGTYYNKFANKVPAINIANALKGTDSATEADGTMYVLAKPEGKEVGFYLAEGGTIAAGKAYYQPTSPQGVKAFYFSADDATGIENLNNQNTLNTPIYNLAGQRVSKMQKGINIVSGKKILK